MNPPLDAATTRRRRPAADTAATIRAALRAVVATEGFHGASMSKVAAAAGVAVGTAYVHYSSKDELVLAAYAEVKRDLGEAATSGLDPALDAATRFGTMWRNLHAHLCTHPGRARFLLQVDASPFAGPAHARAEAEGAAGAADPLMVEAARPDLAAQLAALPPRLLFELAFGPAVWLAAHGVEPSPEELEVVAAACWRAVTTPG